MELHRPETGSELHLVVAEGLSKKGKTLQTTDFTATHPDANQFYPRHSSYGTSLKDAIGNMRSAFGQVDVLLLILL